MAIITKEFSALLTQELERVVRPVFEEMSEDELRAFLTGIGPALEADPFMFSRIFK